MISKTRRTRISLPLSPTKSRTSISATRRAEISLRVLDKKRKPERSSNDGDLWTHAYPDVDKEGELAWPQGADLSGCYSNPIMLLSARAEADVFPPFRRTTP